MTILLRSDQMDLAEAMVFFAVNGHAPGKPALQFAVSKLNKLRDAWRMMQLLQEYHSTGEIFVVNLETVRHASALDGFLEDVKDTLLGIFHPAPGADEEAMKKGLGLGEVEAAEPAREIRLGAAPKDLAKENMNLGSSFFPGHFQGGETGEWIDIGLPAFDEELIDRELPLFPENEEDDDFIEIEENAYYHDLEKEARGSATMSPSDIEEQVKESLWRGEVEQRGIDYLKALTDSLLQDDVKGVVPEEALRQIHSIATTVLSSLRRLQRVIIPSALSEIQKTRNTEVVMPYHNL